ncbi:MAG: hypothetical protein PHC51_08425 [bacterium]|nr:hypothetical protein [bacterium]
MKTYSIQGLAEKIHRAGLTQFAIFLLEAHRPLRGLLNQVCLAFSPLSLPLLGEARQKLILELLNDDHSIEELLQALEKPGFVKSKKPERR